MAKIELEAWFLSKNDKAHYPSGPIGVQINKDVPFKVTHPKRIKFFKDVAEHNKWLTKIDAEAAARKLGISTSKNEDDENYLANRAFADDKIEDLSKEISFLEQSLIDKDTKILTLENELKEVAQYKDMYDESQADIAKLDKTVNRLKKKLTKANGG